ncbi:MAG: hypothetical protein IKR41_03975 [Bacteroidales bacterium]|nr:hypothetical protein [Bacteroidales bacterium]
MLTCEIKTSGQKSIQLTLPSEPELQGAENMILSQSAKNKYFEFKTLEYVNNQTIVMIKSFSAKEDCTIEAIRIGKKAIILSAIINGSVSEINSNELTTHNVGSIGLGLMSEKNFHVTQLNKGGFFEKLNIIISNEDWNIILNVILKFLQDLRTFSYQRNLFFNAFLKKPAKSPQSLKNLKQVLKAAIILHN